MKFSSMFNNIGQVILEMKKLGFRVQLFRHDFFPLIKIQDFGQMTRFLYFSMDFSHFFIKISCFSSKFRPFALFGRVQGLAFLSCSFRGSAFRSSILSSMNELKILTKMMKKSSKKWKPLTKIIRNPLKSIIINSNWDYFETCTEIVLVDMAWTLLFKRSISVERCRF